MLKYFTKKNGSGSLHCMTLQPGLWSTSSEDWGRVASSYGGMLVCSNGHGVRKWGSRAEPLKIFEVIALDCKRTPFEYQNSSCLLCDIIYWQTNCGGGGCNSSALAYLLCSTMHVVGNATDRVEHSIIGSQNVCLRTTL